MSVLMTDPEAGHVAVFDEAPGDGDPMDPNALRNRPLKDPINWLANLKYHSAFNLLELMSDTEVIVAHPAVSAVAGASGETISGGSYSYNGGQINYPVLDHDADGYEPLIMVAVGNNILTPGYIIQANAGGAARYISAYSTPTQVFIREVASRGTTVLPTLNQTYRILVFKNPPAPVGPYSMEIDPIGNVFRLGQGRFDLSRRYMQVRPGGTPFGLATRPSITLGNGAVVFRNPSGSDVNPIPYSLSIAIRVSGQPAVFGGSMGFLGVIGSMSSIPLQVP